MEATQRLVRTWMASGRGEEIDETVAEISNERTTLINVVKALGEYLTSEEDHLRTKVNSGVDFLSLVLGRCSAEKLNRPSVRVLTSFYCEKLDDTETIIPALSGLVTLSALPTFSSTEATSVVHALFAHVKMKALVQSVRFFVFVILDTLIAKHREALHAMGKVFVAGYISLAEGEKDPRNLLVAFAIARVILIEFDIYDHTESLFNITFCYFPITFRPPPNDPYGVTTEDLRLALRGCLSATPAFGPLAIPVFLEKLAAGSPTTKRDTMQALATCLPVYGSLLARASARKLWNALKLEIFQPVDPLTEQEALKITQVLVKTIYADEDNATETNKDIQGLARDACEECIQILREPEKSQAKPAIKVLGSFMATTPSVSRYTLSQAVPHLMGLFLSPDEISNRRPILLLLADLINAARDSMSSNLEGSEQEGGTPLIPYKDEVLGAMSVGLRDIASRRPALAGIMGMVTTKSLFSDEELGFVVHIVNEALQEEDDGADVRESVLDVLSTISTIAPRHVEEQSLPLLFESLPDRAPSREAASDRARSWRVLSALSVLCVQPELFEILVIRLTTRVDLICIPMEASMDDDEPNAAYAHSLLKIIANTLSTKVDRGHLDIAKYVDRLVPRLFNLFLYSALPGEGQGLAATNHRLVSVAGEIITLVIQCVPLTRQERFSTDLFRAISSGNFEGIADGYQKIPADSRLLIFNDAASSVQKNLIMLFAAGTISLRKELRPPVPDLDDFLDGLLTWSLEHADNDLQRNSAWHMVSSIVNKRAEDVMTFLTHKLDNFWTENVISRNRPLAWRQHAIQSWIWISRALMVRNHPLATQFTARVFEAFSDEIISWDAAKAIGDIAASDPILTKRCHAVIKILHAQKFVIAVLPRIIAGSQDSSTGPREQTAYLVALTSLVKAVPKATYVHEMTTLMPLFLRGLELPDANIRANVIDTLLVAAEGDPSEQGLVSEYASTLVSTMLKNSVVERMPSLRVRLVALRYLGVLPCIVRYDVLHPHKSAVIRELAKAVDDPKRAVRKEAVNTRMIWFKCSG